MRRKGSSAKNKKIYAKWLAYYKKLPKSKLEDLMLKQRTWDKSWYPHEFTFVANTPKKRALYDAFMSK